MNRQNKILAGTFVWGLSNLAAYHILKYRMLKHVDALNKQIDVALDISAALARDLSPEQLNAALEDPRRDYTFLDHLDN